MSGEYLYSSVIDSAPDQHLMKDIPLHKRSRGFYGILSGLCTAVASYMQMPHTGKKNIRGGKGKVRLPALFIGLFIL